MKGNVSCLSLFIKTRLEDSDMTGIANLDKKHLKLYLITVCILYIALGIVIYTQGTGGMPAKYLPTVFIMPLAIMFVGILRFNLRDKVKKVLTVVFILYLPLHILTFVLGNNEIMVHGAVFYNYLLCASVIAFFLFFTLSLRITTVISCVIFFIFLTVNTWVSAFRGNAVTPGDVLAIGTALKVSGGYKYFVSLPMLSSLLYSIIIIQLVFKLCCPIRLKKIYLNIALRLAFLAVSAVCLISFTARDESWSSYGYLEFDVNKSNKNFGVLTTFVNGLKKTVVTEPEGYNEEKARQILENTEDVYQPEQPQEQPNVIVIMNEGFADPEEIYNITPSEDPLKYWHSLEENTVSGDMRVSVYGGGTSFTEFEFLTGIAGGIINSNQTPYVNLIKGNTPSLAWDFKNAGYKTLAIHPFWSSSWNRANVYPRLGFDEFISGEDFSSGESKVSISSPDEGSSVLSFEDAIMQNSSFGDDLEYIREYISDRESYKKVIEQFENKQEDDKLFIFNVTVQNHGGFDYDGDDFVNDVTVTQEGNIDIDQYLSLIKQSDIAYGELIEYFKNYDEPTIILMFGDHQPSLTYLNLVEKDDLREEYADEYNAEDTYRYIVPYKMWANFDIGTKEEPMTGTSFLSLLVKDKAGLEFNKWDEYRLKLKDSFQALNSKGIFNKEGDLVYYGDDESIDKQIDEYKFLEYYLLFDK